MSRKRRGRGEASVFERADGQWVGAISLGYDDKGKRNRKTVYGSTKGEVQEKIDDLKNDARAGILPDAKRLTVSHNRRGAGLTSRCNGTSIQSAKSFRITRPPSLPLDTSLRRFPSSATVARLPPQSQAACLLLCPRSCDLARQFPGNPSRTLPCQAVRKQLHA